MQKMISLLTAFILLIESRTIVAETALKLELPVDCIIGEICLIQKLFDRQEGQGRREYRCGTLTTEEHHGIDIRLRTLSDMKKGTAVIAAADGIVLRTRDGMADVNVRLPGNLSVADKMAGNAVVISHGSGWETQYSHLQQGSLRVKPGDRVNAGTRLGLIGMSGNAEFPHLHFEIRKDGKAIDPFMPNPLITSCDALNSTDSLWSSRAAQSLAYKSGGIIAAGFTSEKPEAIAIRQQSEKITQLSSASPALVFWIDAYGVEAGDIEKVEIQGPDNTLILQTQKEITKPALSWFSYFGKKRTAVKWLPGRYTATYQLLRKGSAPITIKQPILIVDQ
jgi:Peptidase family M23